MLNQIKVLMFTLLSCFILASVFADVPDELKIKREANFEFEVAPSITRNEDKFTISFTTKGFCDVTVAIENSQGDIVRHLASGVLGTKAPEPFQVNSKSQKIIWDSKNDKGEYVKNVEELTIRVSLGLKPLYNQTLFWEPKKRISRGGAGTTTTEDVIPIATPEGVYVYDGNGIDLVKLFDHKGNYIKTVYPFPAENLEKIEGLVWKDYPHGYKRPQKNGINQTTFLTSGNVNSKQFKQAGAYTMSVWSSGNKGNIALAKISLNRLSTLGDSAIWEDKKLNLNGPDVWLELNPNKPFKDLHDDTRVCPYGSAFSPDGKKLYLTGFNNQSGRRKHWLDGVMVMDYASNEKPKVFVGEFKPNNGMTTSVACDKEGRVYVANYTGSSIDVYSPEAKLLKQIPIEHPTSININPVNGEIYVFSWYVGGIIWHVHPNLKDKKNFPTPTLTILKSFDDNAVKEKYSLPYMPIFKGGVTEFYGWGDTCHGTQYRATVDFWAEKPTIWLIPKNPMGIDIKGTEGMFNWGAGWENSGPILLQAEGKELKTVGNFSADAAKSVLKLSDCLGHQRIYVNPLTKKLYATGKEVNVGGGEFVELWEIDPESGKVRHIPLPISSAEDMAIDQSGLFYFRQVGAAKRVIRFAIDPWRQIPWDYGVEGKDKKQGDIISSINLPQALKGTGWQSEGGIWISPKGNLAVWVSVKNSDPNANVGRPWEKQQEVAGEEYSPPAYPGRASVGCIHVWDDRGKLIYEDAVPGVDMTDGVAIDNDDNIYMMTWAPRVFNGVKYFNGITGTLIKAKAGKSKFYTEGTSIPLPLPEEQKPKRPQDISGYTLKGTWVEGADWFYGGVGLSPFKIAPGCICWQHSKFTLDYFSRSFAPEVDQFSVAVVDKNGNLITRIGKYGNTDDGLPLKKDGAFNPPNPKSIGGDEVAIMHAAHVATFSDRHLYISDIGNTRIVQVKLDYHKNSFVPIKGFVK